MILHQNQSGGTDGEGKIVKGGKLWHKNWFSNKVRECTMFHYIITLTRLITDFVQLWKFVLLKYQVCFTRVSMIKILQE